MKDGSISFVFAKILEAERIQYNTLIICRIMVRKVHFLVFLVNKASKVIIESASISLEK